MVYFQPKSFFKFSFKFFILTHSKRKIFHVIFFQINFKLVFSHFARFKLLFYAVKPSFLNFRSNHFYYRNSVQYEKHRAK